MTTLAWFKGVRTLPDAHRRFMELSRQYHPDRAGRDQVRAEELGRTLQEISAEYYQLKAALELLPELVPDPPAAASAPKRSPATRSRRTTSSTSSGSSSTSSSPPRPKRSRPPASAPPDPPAARPPDPPAMAATWPAPGEAVDPLRLLIRQGLAWGIERGIRWIEHRIEQATNDRTAGSS